MTLQLIASNETACSGLNYPGVRLRVEVYQEDNGSGVNFGGNFYNLYRKVMLVKRGASGSGTSTYNANNNCSASFSAEADLVAGLDLVWSEGGKGYDFRSSSGRNAQNTVQMLGEGWFTVAGKADRTARTVAFAAGWDSPGGDILGDTSTSASATLAGIAEAPSAPSIASFTGASSSTAALEWTVPASDGGAAISGYRIVFANNSGFSNPSTLDVAAASLTRVLAGLAPGQWWAKVAALNAATAAGATLNYSSAGSTVVTADIGDLDGWSSFGTLPAGLAPLVTGALRRGSVYPLGDGAPTGLLREIQCSGSGSVAAAAVGLQRTFTGLVVGRTYKLNGTVLSLQGTTPQGNLYRWAVVGVGQGTNATTSDTTHPVAIPEYTFVAAATSHVVQIQLNEAAAWSASGWFEAAGFYGITLTEVPDASPYRVQDVALESSLAKHFTVACDTVGAAWWVDSDDVTQFRQVADDGAIRGIFTDVRAAGELEYTDLVASYDTRNVVNTLTAKNYGRDAATGNSRDADYAVADAVSVAEWGVRAGSVEMCLRSGYVEAINLDTNPSMEGTPLGWNSFALSNMSASTAQFHSGTRSLLINSANTSDNYAWKSYTVEAGKTYRVSAYVRIAGTGTTFSSRNLWGWDGANVSTIQNATYDQGLLNQWQRVSFTITPLTTTLTVRLYAYNSSGPNIWVDDVMVTEGSTLWPYFDGTTVDAGGDLIFAWTGAAHASTATRTSWEYLNDRLAEIVAKSKTPRRVISQIVWNAQEDPRLAALLDVQDRIRVRFRGTTNDYRIVGIRHKVTGTRWLMTLSLIPS